MILLNKVSEVLLFELLELDLGKIFISRNSWQDIFVRRAHDPKDFVELVSLVLACEKRFPQSKLSKYAAHRPDIDGGGILIVFKQQLRSSIVQSHDVLCVWFDRN